jgi:hypothetical protein
MESKVERAFQYVFLEQQSRNRSGTEFSTANVAEDFHLVDATS